MPRKPPKGYFVRGHFVVVGSPEDAELKRAAKWDAPYSKTDLKKQSAERQALGERLLTIKDTTLQRLALPESLLDALREARRIDDFEGRRRQLQYIGKLMRQLDDAQIAAIEAALDEAASRRPAQSLQEAERWRARLIEDDEALQAWRSIEPDADWQRLRALIRQARKDAAASADEAAPTAPRGRAWRELFAHVRAVLEARATPT
jgi:ribosome-associated protein